MSTPATSKSVTVKKLIKNYCKNIKVLNLGCKNLENIVENGEINDTELLRKYLKQVARAGADSLVLGCTHYVFLKDAIWKIIDPNIKLIDGNLAISKRVKSLLLSKKIKNSQKTRGRVEYVTTGNPVKFSKVAGKLLQAKIAAKRIKI